MKIRSALSLVLGLALALCLCVPSAPAQAEAPSPDDLTELAQTLVQNMYEGDMDSTVKLLDPSIADELPAEALVAAVGQMPLLAGDFERITGAVRHDTPQGILVDVYAQHVGRPVRWRFVFNETSLITGLWMQPVTPEEVAAHFPGETEQDAAEGEGQEHPVTVGEYALPGVITVPTGERQPIAVLLVAGSGPNDRDSTVGRAANKPLRDLALGLAQHGISSLRYDKRSVARPDALGDTPTIEAEVLDDVAAAVELLATHDETRDARLFVIGHSLGGMLTPAILAQNPQLSGAVILAGTPRTLWDVIYDEGTALIPTLDQYSQKEKDALLKEGADMRDQANAVTAGGEGQIFGMPLPYIASLNNLHLENTARNTEKPLLILQGDRDAQVSAEIDYAAWQTLLEGRENARFKLYPGLNHLFMDSLTGTLEDYNTPGNVSPEVIDDIAAWLLAQVE